MMGNDPDCSKWIKKYRVNTSEDQGRSFRERRKEKTTEGCLNLKKIKQAYLK